MPLINTRGLNFDLSLYLHSFFVYALREETGESAPNMQSTELSYIVK